MSGSRSRLKVVLCWHMHQPDYRGPKDGDYRLPWVYLHGIKDYADMAAHLEDQPGARAVVNFAPVLLEQLRDYARQIQAWLSRRKRIRDPLLAALAGPGLPRDAATRRNLIKACLRANDKNLIGRFKHFKHLAEMAELALAHRNSYAYVSDQFLVDLLVWYHLAWMGESIRENDIRVRSLQKKAEGFSQDDRRCLMELIAELLGGLVARYRALAESGRVELSVTPYAHPIVPLLLDIRSAREALPEIQLPELETYPGGEERARWHVRRGLETFAEHFGYRPVGCWPSEGALSGATIRLLEDEGFRWVASGQQVLLHSLTAHYGDQALPAGWVHQPYRSNGGTATCFFRDDGLSDLIGFTFAEWHADDAVSNLIEHLEHIAVAQADNPAAVVSIIMDGENAWESYPLNGSYFLSTLYERLDAHPDLEMTTFSDCIPRNPASAADLPAMVAGSWVYGTLSTWIGDPDKNKAWEMLGEAKRRVDLALDSGTLSESRWLEIQEQLAVCEGSDWFWWFGDYNPSDAVSDFERLYRQHLSALYKLLGESPPEYLSRVFAHGHGKPDLGGVMRKN